MGLRVQGRYRIVSELGAGAFGTVCLADDDATTHEVAIRFLSGPAGVANAAQALRRRGRSLVEASTAHPALASPVPRAARRQHSGCAISIPARCTAR